MSPLEYFAEALSSWPEYIELVVLFLALHGLLIRFWAVGVFDPLFMLLVSNAFGWSIVWFMYLRGDIAPVYVLSFSAAELAFYIGIWTGKLSPGSIRSSLSLNEGGQNLPVLALGMASIVHIVSTISIWKVAGIPLFRDSRLGAFEGSGGLGILERLTDSSILIGVFAIVYLLIHHRWARRSYTLYCLVLWYVADTALSGSKGAFLTLGQYVLSILFIYTALRYRKDRFWGGRAGKPLFAISTVFAIGVLATQNSGDLGIAFVGFVYRVVSYGDVFVFAYPDATIESIKGSNPLVGMFGGFLSTFRLFPQDSIYPNMGYQFTGIIFPDLDLFVGPNPQHPIFGYHYFGMAAPVFSFVLGVITARLHANFYQQIHSSFLGGLIIFMLYFSLIGISIDFDYSLSRLASMLIGLIVVIGPILLVRPNAVRLRRTRNRPLPPSLSAT